MTRKQVPIPQLKPGPIRRDQLSLSLIDRINYLRQILDEVYPQPMEEWLDGFQRDAHPESEILWWERLSECYLGYTLAKDLSLEQKRAVFKILLALGMGSDLRALSAELGCLPYGAREEILALTGKAIQ